MKEEEGSHGGSSPEVDISANFENVALPDEQEAIAARREMTGVSAGHGNVGLALSGGGLHTAAFHFGVLQALERRGLLRWVDYLSAVSGGAYLAAGMSSHPSDACEQADESNKKDDRKEIAPHEAAGGSGQFSGIGTDDGESAVHQRLRRECARPWARDSIVVLMRGAIMNLFAILPVVAVLAMVTVVSPPYGVFFFDLEFTGFSAEELGRGEVVLENTVQFFLPTVLLGFTLLVWLVSAGVFADREASGSRVDRGISLLIACTIVVAVFNLLPFLFFVVFNGNFDTPPWRVSVAAALATVAVGVSLVRRVERERLLTAATDKVRLAAVCTLGPTMLLGAYFTYTNLLVRPLTVPFGDEASALNVAVLASPAELDRPTSEILDEVGTYQRWVNALFDDVGDTSRAEVSFGDFLTRALRRPDAGLSSSLQRYQATFWPAIRLRSSPLGVSIFGPNRFDSILATRPASAEPDNLLFPDESGLDPLIYAARTYRRDLVLIHAAILAFVTAVLTTIVYSLNVNRTGLQRVGRSRVARVFFPSGKGPTRLSAVDPSATGGPYLILNSNLSSEVADYRSDQLFEEERRTPFFLSPRWCGSDATGYCRTEQLEQKDRHFDLATAAQISGAGTHLRNIGELSPTTGRILKVLSLREDYWLSNPRFIARPRPRKPNASFMIREVSGKYDLDASFVNLSAGDRVDVLGLAELLRRRCRYVVVSDAARDPDLQLGGPALATSLARTLGVTSITWKDRDVLQLSPTTGLSGRRWATAEVEYNDGTSGRIIYLKATVDGSESLEIDSYRARFPDFPHQGDSSRGLTRDEFEAYRGLGEAIADELFEQDGVEDIGEWFDDVDQRALGLRRAQQEDIFVCYRRSDSEYVVSFMRSELVERFGEHAVFTDVEGIPLGVDFRDFLEEKVGGCKVLLAVIGPEWLAVDGSGKRRIDDERDFVRIEIEHALDRNIPVIPVLLRNMTVPREDELPPSLARLAFRNGIEVRPDPNFSTDMARLVEQLEAYLDA